MAMQRSDINLGVGEEKDCRKHRKITIPDAVPQAPDPETFARSYQLEALEKSLRENTIAFLETGSGKTLIAIMLLRAYAHLLRKPSDFIAVFLVPTVVLVQQQAEVVEMHTDLKVGKYWGQMGVDFWTRETWNNELKKYEVFVMTPQILLDNLRHCFFKLEKIKLLIFDECHHASGKHPYACIMKEFYHRQLLANSTQLPRIFGMTASLVKGSVSREMYGNSILKLETILNSKVYTVQNESVLAEFIAFSTPKVKIYRNMDIPYDLFLCLADHLEGLKNKHLQALQELQLSDGEKLSAEKKIVKLFATYIFCLQELGVWLAMKASESLLSVETSNFFWAQMSEGLGDWTGLGERTGFSDRTVRNFSQDVFKVLSQCIPSEWCIGNDPRADIDAGFLTAKVDCLIQSLMDYRMMKDLRCIIFVERVISAIVLDSLLSQVSKLSCWKSKYMAGNRSGLHSQTRRDQMHIVDSFREGKVNIIVATAILEEGLDVQSCNLVVRFDPSVTLCSFIQSRGRARMQGSDYLLLVRSGDKSTLSRVRSYLAGGDIMREESTRQASVPCAPLDSEMRNEDFYIVESTGAIVTLSSSVALLYFYCSRLPSDGYFRPSPRFVIDKLAELCTLHLPKSCPLQPISVRGPVGTLKQIACLEACKKLHEIGAITDYLLPEFHDVEDNNALECGDISYEPEQVNYYPGELVDHWPSFSSKGSYHCYSLGLKRNFDYDAAFRDIVLIVKCDLGSDFMNTCFPLGGNVSVNMQYAGVIRLGIDQVNIARRFQIMVLRLLIDHNMSALKDALDGLQQEETISRTAYLLLPSIGCNKNSPIIDWDCVRSCLFSSGVVCSGSMVMGTGTQHYCSSEDIRMMQTKNAAACCCMLTNSLVFTPHNGRVYCITCILEDLDGNSTMKIKGEENCTYKEYYQRRHGITLRYERESLLGGKHLFTVQNWLQRRQPLQEKESNNSVELPPELCVIVLSNITISTLYSFSFVPCIMHRIESTLLAARLRIIQMNHYTQKNVFVPALEVLEAITTKKCQEEFSLESLETLGDSFLKYAASQQLFRSNIYHHEGLLSAKKDKMIRNDTLCNLGCKQKLQGFIRNEIFNPKMWVIPGDRTECLLEDDVCFSTSKVIYSRGKKLMKSKVVADVVEALIGAYLTTGGELTALFLMEWLGMKINFVEEVPSNIPFLEKPEMYVNVHHLESLLKYKFRNPSLLVEALTHGSYQLPEIPRCYQRLEFLGDAVLDYLITVHLYNQYPGLSPGFLTDLRSASVNNDCYAHAAAKAGLNKHIIHASSEIQKQIESFVKKFEQSFSGPIYGWEAETHFPKVLGDVIESIAGAILVDSGYDKAAVWESIRPLLEPMVTPDTIKYQPVRELEEISRKKSNKNPEYIARHHDGVVSITAEVIVDGITFSETKTGRNKKATRKLAAKAVLNQLKSSVPEIA
ncbi:endoribonuclease Dicer 2 isoform X1 [Cinnamomum micranthum f. kanehirae]|uniref:Endoribonuclease Dicer 2 isoform X1 n=1 Tax=Cinnamomum micranthum f. kanehirae TaxID=337451 RepID=A0A3S3MDG1_9MAGN|nr:endoribonuclease Dicer 2 isoform X1 [Cinnamomum micranthum f. kanehirae]